MIDGDPRPWTPGELEELGAPTRGDVFEEAVASLSGESEGRGVVIELLDRLDAEQQEARRAMEREPVGNRAWLCGYLDALERTYTAVERHAAALGLLTSGWR